MENKKVGTVTLNVKDIKYLFNAIDFSQPVPSKTNITLIYGACLASDDARVVKFRKRLLNIISNIGEKCSSDEMMVTKLRSDLNWVMFRFLNILEKTETLEVPTDLFYMCIIKALNNTNFVSLLSAEEVKKTHSLLKYLESNIVTLNINSDLIVGYIQTLSMLNKPNNALMNLATRKLFANKLSSIGNGEYKYLDVLNSPIYLEVIDELNELYTQDETIEENKVKYAELMKQADKMLEDAFDGVEYVEVLPSSLLALASNIRRISVHLGIEGHLSNIHDALNKIETCFTKEYVKNINHSIMHTLEI